MLTLLFRGRTVYDLTATGIATGAPTVGTPAVTQKHVLTATGIATGAPAIGSPAITQVHALSATGIVASPAVGSPAIGQEHALTATGVSTGAPAIGSPALTQEHALSALPVAAGAPSVGSPVIGQIHALTATGVSASPTVGSPALTSFKAGSTGVDFGIGASIQSVGDTRWEGVRKAREAAREAFRELEAPYAARRKKAVQRASEAVQSVARIIGENIRASGPAKTPLPFSGGYLLDSGGEAWADVLQDLEGLRTVLEGLAAAERVRLGQARAAAEQWARIEAELRFEARAEEELMVVLALAL